MFITTFLVLNTLSLLKVSFVFQIKIIFTIRNKLIFIGLATRFLSCMTICNFIAIQHISITRVLLNKLHKLQQTQLIIFGTINACDLCNLVANVWEQLLCDSNPTNLQLPF
jgi:hypothetical protein